jgi:hypothetical protein
VLEEFVIAKGLANVEFIEEVGGGLNFKRNAALNLKRLATATALPVASPSGNGGAASGTTPVAAGKVTPVRHEFGQQDGSGQEKNRAHLRAFS